MGFLLVLIIELFSLGVTALSALSSLVRAGIPCNAEIRVVDPQPREDLGRQ